MEIEPEFRYSQPSQSKAISSKWAISILVVTVVVLIALFFGMNRKTSWLHFTAASLIDPSVAIRLNHEADALIDHLNKEPCNRDISIELAQTLLEHNEYGAALKLYQNQITQCGARDDLLPIVFSSQMGLSDFASAEKTANKLVVLYPESPSAFGWRAEAREQNANLSGAYADMKMALSLFSDPSNVALQVFYDTAKLANKNDQPCEAITFLRDYIAYDAMERRSQQLDTIMKQWQTAGNCPTLFGAGSAMIHYNKRDSAIIVPVEINGVVAHMIVDTGATSTLISQQFAKRAGIQTSSITEADTPNGSMSVSSGRAKIISLGKATLRDAPIFVKNTSENVLGDDVDGLLGLSFLGNFHVQINDGTLELRPIQ